jgi:hypothetical protein
MFYIQKKQEAPIEFQEAVRGLEKYQDLQGENKRIVTELLLKEQKGLCPLCERQYLDNKGEEPKIVFIPTIEHFLPLSIFDKLGLDYHNLYVSCKTCNEPKSNHLIPAYIFDPRFNPFQTKFIVEHGLKIKYEQKNERDTVVLVPLAQKENPNNPNYYGATLIQKTLDLTCQNRYEIDDKNYKPEISLMQQRGITWKLYMEKFKGMTPELLQEKYLGLRNSDSYPQFISLIAFLYQKALLRKNLPIPPYNEPITQQVTVQEISQSVKQEDVKPKSYKRNSPKKKATSNSKRRN